MDRRETLFRELCLEIACERVGGERFQSLLMELGVLIDENEWAVTNHLLEKWEWQKTLHPHSVPDHSNAH